jgi:predicted amidohydrolase
VKALQPDAGETLGVAVVQPRLDHGDVARNLRRLEDLVVQAVREHDPDMVLLPEAMGGPALLSSSVTGRSLLPIDGPPYELLRRAAREHGCWIGGGYLAIDNDGAPRHAYVLADPTGATHVHRKDRPDPWEASRVLGGVDDGFASTPIAPIGLVCGLEWLRPRTARRLAGMVRLLAGGAAVPSFPLARVAKAGHTREAVSRLARSVGAPAAVAHQVGPTHSGRPASLQGESRIVDRDGSVLASLCASDGEAYVAADVRLAEPEPLEPAPHSFWWRPRPPVTARLGWRLTAAAGRSAYRVRRRASGDAGGQQPREPILAYNPQDLPPELRSERMLIAVPYGTDPVPPREAIPG